jgi:hypothetical protein
MLLPASPVLLPPAQVLLRRPSTAATGQQDVDDGRLLPTSSLLLPPAPVLLPATAVLLPPSEVLLRR